MPMFNFSTLNALQICPTVKLNMQLSRSAQSVLSVWESRAEGALGEVYSRYFGSVRSITFSTLVVALLQLSSIHHLL